MKYDIISLVGCLFVLQMIMLTTATAVTDCRACHRGGTIFNATDTIFPDDETCFQCHNTKYLPTWQGFEIHGVHAGEIRVLTSEEYISRHPKTSKKCSICHQHEYDCKDCHSVVTSHTGDGSDCTGCHNTMENLFKHREINLTKHNIFGIEAPGSCNICHNTAKGVLNLASGKTLGINESSELCRQCHSTTYKEWKNSEHWPAGSNVDPAIDKCSFCHDVHAPEYLYWTPPHRDKPSGFTVIGAVVIAGFSGLFAILLVKRYDRSIKKGKK